MKNAAAALASIFLGAAAVAAGEVGFVEDFALARDRTVALRQLVPGTEDYHYFHALHFLNTDQFDRAAEQTKPWLARFGRTPRLLEIQTRHALLTYDRDPARSLAFLRGRLGLHFNHEREVPGAVLNLPTALDPQLIARDRLRDDAFARAADLSPFEDAALDWLATTELTPQRLRHLLQRLPRPDVAALPQLVDADLPAPNAPGFGAYPLHAQMTLAQLDALLKLRPALLNQAAFVNAWITKLRPGEDENWRRDPTATRAYLDRLEQFVNRLAPAHNALKAHVLFHRLAVDRGQGAYDRARFLAYLKLPRQQGYMARALLERDEARRWPADLNADFSPVTLLPRVGADEPLGRSYLERFLADADAPKEFEPFVNDVYLKHLYAEVQVVNGKGDPDQWAAQLPPELFKALKERVDVDFAFTNQAD